MQGAALGSEERRQKAQPRGQHRHEIADGAQHRRRRAAPAALQGLSPCTDTTLIPAAILPIVCPPAAVNSMRYPPSSRSRNAVNGTGGRIAQLAELQAADLQREVQHGSADRPEDRRRRRSRPAAGRAPAGAVAASSDSDAGADGTCGSGAGHRAGTEAAVPARASRSSTGSSDGRPRAAAGDRRFDRRTASGARGTAWRRDQRRILVDRPILEQRQIERARDRTRLRHAGSGQRRPRRAARVPAGGRGAAGIASARDRRAVRSLRRRSGSADRASSMSTASENS